MNNQLKSWSVQYVVKKSGQATESTLMIQGENAVRALNDFFEDQSKKLGIFRSDIAVTALKTA
ncbi:hypothetical protein AAH446_05930 [Erwinia sp. P6884]|uniref:hypothetical protein n=1 Tax=Erwiniaceae TaxID=1903409 RepID=UPI00319A441A